MIDVSARIIKIHGYLWNDMWIKNYTESKSGFRRVSRFSPNYRTICTLFFFFFDKNKCRHVVWFVRGLSVYSKIPFLQFLAINSYRSFVVNTSDVRVSSVERQTTGQSIPLLQPWNFETIGARTSERIGRQLIPWIPYRVEGPRGLWEGRCAAGDREIHRVREDDGG